MILEAVLYGFATGGAIVDLLLVAERLFGCVRRALEHREGRLLVRAIMSSRVEGKSPDLQPGVGVLAGAVDPHPAPARSTVGGCRG